MVLKIPPVSPRRIRPSTPTVVLTDEAYDALFKLSCVHNVSMRQLASAMIIQAAEDGVEIIEKGDEKNGEDTENRS